MCICSFPGLQCSVQMSAGCRRKNHRQRTFLMDLCITIKGISFLLQTGLGILANASVLMAYGHIAVVDSRLQPVDRILAHIAFANLLLLLTRGVPQTMTVFGLHHLLDDPGCKVVIYAYRIGRALSVCLTCMLSVFQALTIAPATGACLSRIKSDLTKLVMPTFAGLWILNMIVCLAAPMFSIAPRNGTVPPFTLNLGFCHVDFRDNLSYVVNGAILSTRDFTFVALMLSSSIYILVLLHRHTRQVRAIRRGQGSSMEMHAAKTVVMLVLLYSLFFGIDNIIWIYMLTVAQVPAVVSDMRVFFSSCYATFSPMLMISSNKKIKARMVCAAVDQPAQDSTEKSNAK